VPKILSLQAELERAGDTTVVLPMDCISQEFLIYVDAEASFLSGTDSFARTTDQENEDFRHTPSPSPSPSPLPGHIMIRFKDVLPQDRVSPQKDLHRDKDFLLFP
jgi:hypothetical protein